MAAHNLYIAQSATVAGTTLKGFVTVAVTTRGTPVRPRGDGKLYGELTALVNIEETLVIEAEDVGVAPALGATGSLLVENARLAGGVSLNGSWKIETATNATVTVTEVERTVNSDGQPRVRLTVVVNSPNGTASGLAFTVVAPT